MHCAGSVKNFVKMGLFKKKEKRPTVLTIQTSINGITELLTSVIEPDVVFNSYEDISHFVKNTFEKYGKRFDIGQPFAILFIGKL